MATASRKHPKRRIRAFDIHCLGVFRTIVEADGVSTAATRMNLDVSTVSRQLKDLEIRLGMRLCERGRSGFALSPEGEAVYQLSCDMLRTIEDFEDRIDEIRNRNGGELRIGAVNHVLTSSDIKLDQVIRSIHKTAPDLDVSYRVLPSRNICRAVLDGQIHLGITAHERDHPDLERFVLYVEKHHLYCGTGHPLFNTGDKKLKARDISGHKYVAREHRAFTDITAEEFGLERGVVANDIEAITVLVESGLYLGYLPTHHVEALPVTSRLSKLDIANSNCDVPLYIYHRKGARQLNSVQMFLDELDAETRNCANLGIDKLSRVK